jgi:hypothetical protein
VVSDIGTPPQISRTTMSGDSTKAINVVDKHEDAEAAPSPNFCAEWITKVQAATVSHSKVQQYALVTTNPTLPLKGSLGKS